MVAKKFITNKSMISKMLKVLERQIQVLHFLVCRWLGFFSHGPRKWGLNWVAPTQHGNIYFDFLGEKITYQTQFDPTIRLHRLQIVTGNDVTTATSVQPTNRVINR